MATTCQPVPDFLRLSYYYGQMLGQHELATEQRFHLDKHALHNRCLHGHGVVCGLAVVQPTPPLPVETSVVVECGYAIDPAGNDILLRAPVTVDLFKALSAADQALLDPQNGTTLWVSICYQEQKINPTRPVLPDSCGAAPDCMYGMIREGACVIVTVARPVGDPRCDSCCEAAPQDIDRCVLLARIDGFKKGQPLAANAIHNEVRRPIATWARTTLVGINWTHGGSYAASPNAKALLGDAAQGTGGLEFVFSADVRPESIVEGIVDVYRLRPSNGEVVYLAGAVAAGATARSIIFRRNASSPPIAAGDRILITLHGDFVLDMCCRPVDAAHIGGRVPRIQGADPGAPINVPTVCTTPPGGFVWTSGVGCGGGGDFLSWFFVA